MAESIDLCYTVDSYPSCLLQLQSSSIPCFENFTLLNPCFASCHLCILLFLLACNKWRVTTGWRHRASWVWQYYRKTGLLSTDVKYSFLFVSPSSSSLGQPLSLQRGRKNTLTPLFPPQIPRGLHIPHFTGYPRSVSSLNSSNIFSACLAACPNPLSQCHVALPYCVHKRHSALASRNFLGNTDSSRKLSVEESNLPPVRAAENMNFILFWHRQKSFYLIPNTALLTDNPKALCTEKEKLQLQCN